MIAAIPGFQHFPSHHCITGALRHIYAFHSSPLSEEMLLGLGAGVGFIYWHTRGSLPFLGGRANVERPGVEGLEKTVGRRTGVRVETLRSASPAKAEQALLEELGRGQPVMLMVDMGFLPYFDFGGDFHFGGHAVAACGYDPAAQQVLLADRDEPLHPVTLAALRQARHSTYQPFPPKAARFSFDFSAYHPPAAGEVWQAIHEVTWGMLKPPIANLGLKGIRKASERVSGWGQALSPGELRGACINTAIMIDARGGTGGGLFRKMYGRFLGEAAVLTGDARLDASAAAMLALSQRWDALADLFEQAFHAANPSACLEPPSRLLAELAREEETAWMALAGLIPAGLNGNLILP